MVLPAVCENENVPVRFVAMTLFHCSSVISSVGAPQQVRALLIRISTRPNSEAAASTTAWMLFESLASQARPRVLTPHFSNYAAACSQRSFLRPHNTTFEPIFRQGISHLPPEANGSARGNRHAAAEIEDLSAFHETITPADCKERSSASPTPSHSDNISCVCCPSAGAFD